LSTCFGICEELYTSDGGWFSEATCLAFTSNRSQLENQACFNSKMGYDILKHCKLAYF